MEDECSLEGLIDGGSAAPTPWLERGEPRMMKTRVEKMAAIQKTIEGISAPPKLR
jgi:hypothetical protein